MSHNPNMTSSERVFWRRVLQTTFEAASHPEREGAIKSLRSALKGREAVCYPDLRPLPSGVFRGFLLAAQGFANEPDVRLRQMFAEDLRIMADRAGDILDGIVLDEPAASWTERKDING